MNKLVLLDRDGVINFDSPAFVKSVAEWRPIPRSLEAIARLRAAGCKVAVCTNQSGVARGLLSEEALLEIHVELTRRLAEHDSRLDGLRFCPHLPDSGCKCRKPEAGMLLALMSELSVSPEHTCYVGDSLKDILAARNAGCEPVLVRTGNGSAIEARARSLGVARIYDDLWAFAAHETASDSGVQQ